MNICSLFPLFPPVKIPPAYFLWVAVLLLARGVDFLSTWVATPDLALESNPLARRLGWKWGAMVNLVLCLVVGLMPVSAVVICTASVLAAASNCRTAAMMLNFTGGNGGNREGLKCQGAYAGLVGLVGVGFCVKPEWHLGMGVGVVAFAAASILFSVKWRKHEQPYGI